MGSLLPSNRSNSGTNIIFILNVILWPDGEFFMRVVTKGVGSVNFTHYRIIIPLVWAHQMVLPSLDFFEACILIYIDI